MQFLVTQLGDRHLLIENKRGILHFTHSKKEID